MKNNVAKKILIDLMSHLKIQTNKDLAEYLGVKETQIYSWRKHGRITNTGKVLAVCPDIRHEWLETGEGPMLRTDAPRHEVVQAVELVASYIEPLPQKPPDQDYKKEDWSMSEMIIKTTEVLESNTVYRSALAANVRAFHQAVQREVEMQSISEKLEVMQEDNRQEKQKMADRMERLEEMLLSMGAQTGEKKSAG